MTKKLGEQGADDPQVKPPEEKDSSDIASEILADPELPAEDFARARTDSGFMSELIEKRRAAPPEEKPPVEGEEEGEKEPKGKEESEKKKKKRGPRRGGFRRQVERLHDEVAVTKRENDRLRAELAAKSQGKPTPVAPLKETPEPVEDDFDSHMEYLDARTEWKVEQKVTAALKKRDATRPAAPAWPSKRRPPKISARRWLPRPKRPGRNTRTGRKRWTK